MRAGKLRHRIDIQKQQGTATDEAGHQTVDPTTFLTRAANIEPLSGRELWNAQQVQPLVSHRVRLRFESGITTKMRLRWKEKGKVERFLNILQIINPEERDAELELLCTEAV